MEAEAVRQREKAENRIKSRCKDPVAVSMYMELYDDRVRAEYRNSELKREQGRLASHYREAEQKAAEYDRIVSYADRCGKEIERLRLANAKLMEETGRLKDDACRDRERITEQELEILELKRVVGEQKQAIEDLGKQNTGFYEECGILRSRCEESEAEKRKLARSIIVLQEQINAANRNRFGSTSEKTDRVLAGEEPDGDPLSEEASEEAAGNSSSGNEKEEPEKKGKKRKRGAGSGSAEEVTKRTKEKTGEGNDEEESPKGGKRKKKGQRSQNLDGLAHSFDFREIPKELIEKYGEENCSVIAYQCRRVVKELKVTNYVQVTCYPVVRIKTTAEDEGGTYTKVILKTAEKDYDIMPHSYGSKELVSAILTKRFGLSLPFYRLEKDYRSRGLSIPRERMDSWMLDYAKQYFAPVRNRMMEILNGTCSVQQIDETTWRVVIWPDGDRRNGSKGYMWCHTSGELCAGRKIIVYYFEPTRGTDHLRKTLRDYAGMIVSDAYSGYYTIEKECGGRIRVAMCWMHCRRYFAAAVMDAEDRMEGKTPEEILDMPAVKGLLLANRVFAADTPLKQCGDAEERKKRRSGKVAPEMEQFFTFVHGVDTEDEALDPKLREAVVYALNQEAHLRVFLEYGEVPIDNGEAERCFKVIAASRKSSLFSYSLAGAEADAVMHSVVETARANGADVFTYLKYVLEKMPERMAVGEKPEDFMDEMMPWSAEYRDYERLQKERHTDEYVPESNEPAPGAAFRYREIYLRQKAAEAGSSVRTQKTPEKKKTA